jgi:hypothetical protein
MLLTLIDNMQQKRGGYLKVTNRLFKMTITSKRALLTKAFLHTRDEREFFQDINVWSDEEMFKFDVIVN